MGCDVHDVEGIRLHCDRGFERSDWRDIDNTKQARRFVKFQRGFSIKTTPVAVSRSMTPRALSMLAATFQLSPLLVLLIAQSTAFVLQSTPVKSTAAGTTTSDGKNRACFRHIDVACCVRLKLLAAARDDDGMDLSSGPNVLCHGEVLFDCIAKPEAAGWDLDRVVGRGAWTPYPGGAPANVACALSKLGVSATFVGAVGRDENGDELIRVLESNNVNTDFAARIDEYPTRTVMVTRDKEGDRTFAGFGDRKPSDCFADCQHQISGMKEAVMTRLRKPGSWVVQGTLGLAYPKSCQSHVDLASWAKEAGAIRYLDINWRPVFWELAAGDEGDYEALARERISSFSQTADVVKLTDEEAEWLCDIPAQEALEMPSRLRPFFPSAEAILLTAGEKGAAFDIRGQQGFVPCFSSCKVTETTGAGDAFSAGFIASCIQLMSNSTQRQQKPSGARALDLDVGEEMAHHLVRFGSAVGALTCCGDGAIAPQPSIEQVMELLAAKEWLAAVN